MSTISARRSNALTARKARSDGRRLFRCDGRIQLPFTPCELDADPSGLDRLASLRWLSWCAVPCLIDRHRARPVLTYRACEFAAGVGGWPTIIGGLSIPYATIPMNKRTGMTIGGTRYFMVFPLLENWMGGSSRHHFPDAVGALGREPERNVVGPALQHAGEYCRR